MGAFYGILAFRVNAAEEQSKEISGWRKAQEW
jgi:hypothetical protein